MKKWVGRSNGFPAPIVSSGLLITIAAVFIAGCGLFSSTGIETKQLYKGLENSKGSLTKRLAVLPFDNSGEWARIDLATPLLKELKSSIEKECRHVHVLLPDSPGFPPQFKQLAKLEDDEIDNYSLAIIGRTSGINMVLSGRLVDIRYESEDHGVFLWKRTKHLARIQMEFAVYHTGTGAKLLDETIIKDIQIEESEGLQIKENKMPDTFPLADAIADLSETVGEVCDTVFKFVPWEGYVTGVDGNRLILSSGEFSGLKKGKVLDVFSADQVTRGKSGQRFFTVGGKIGRISLTEVNPERSEAILKEGGPIPPGSAVRLP